MTTPPWWREKVESHGIYIYIYGYIVHKFINHIRTQLKQYGSIEPVSRRLTCHVFFGGPKQYMEHATHKSRTCTILTENTTIFRLLVMVYNKYT